MVNYVPISRTGAIASLYGVCFEGRPMFLIDAKLHEGISGSPVLNPSLMRVLPQGMGGETWLLGIISMGNEIEIGYVWYAEIIEQIIDNKMSGKIITS